jgi:hypothetical protein
MKETSKAKLYCKRIFFDTSKAKLYCKRIFLTQVKLNFTAREECQNSSKLLLPVAEDSLESLEVPISQGFRVETHARQLNFVQFGPKRKKEKS